MPFGKAYIKVRRRRWRPRLSALRPRAASLQPAANKGRSCALLSSRGRRRITPPEFLRLAPLQLTTVGATYDPEAYLYPYKKQVLRIA